MTWRYIAQRALTGEFLEWDLPIAREDLSWALSGAGALKGTVSPDVGNLRASDGRLLLEEWGTLIYAEADGRIRWGGIVVSSSFDGAAWSVEAAGFVTYPNGIPYLGSYAPKTVDPADAIREIWRHVQSFPDSNLGVQVDSTRTSVKVGTTAQPYALSWWDLKDSGQEIDSLVKQAPLDYVEDHAWNADGTAITHTIRLGYPRLGRRRTDLAFVQGENVAEVVTPERPGDEFANVVFGLGSGEGSKTVHSSTAVRDGKLRRVATWTDKSASRTALLDSAIKAELQRRLDVLTISKVTVVDHPHAPIGSWALGDDVLIQADLPWLGAVSLWCRVVGWSLVADNRAELDLVRSDSFDYGRPPATS